MSSTSLRLQAPGPVIERKGSCRSRARAEEKEQREGGQVGQAIPVDGDRPELQGDGVDLRVHEHRRVLCQAGVRSAFLAHEAHEALRAPGCRRRRARPGWSRSRQRPAARRAARHELAGCAIDHTRAPELHARSSGTQATPRPPDTRLTMVCIWIASCATARRAAGRVVEAEDGVVQRGHDAARKDHQRLGQHRGQRQPSAPRQRMPRRQRQHQRLVAPPRSRARPGGAKPGECSIRPASISPRARASSCTSPVASTSSSAHLGAAQRGTRAPRPAGARSRWSRRRRGARGPTSPAAAARARAGSAWARASSSRTSRQQRLAGGRQRDAAPRAVEQPHAQRAARAARWPA